MAIFAQTTPLSGNAGHIWRIMETFNDITCGIPSDFFFIKQLLIRSSEFRYSGSTLSVDRVVHIITLQYNFDLKMLCTYFIATF